MAETENRYLALSAETLEAIGNDAYAQDVVTKFNENIERLAAVTNDRVAAQEAAGWLGSSVSDIEMLAMMAGAETYGDNALPELQLARAYEVYLLDTAMISDYINNLENFDALDRALDSRLERDDFSPLSISQDDYAALSPIDQQIVGVQMEHYSSILAAQSSARITHELNEIIAGGDMDALGAALDTRIAELEGRINAPLAADADLKTTAEYMSDLDTFTTLQAYSAVGALLNDESVLAAQAEGHNAYWLAAQNKALELLEVAQTPEEQAFALKINEVFQDVKPEDISYDYTKFGYATSIADPRFTSQFEIENDPDWLKAVATFYAEKDQSYATNSEVAFFEDPENAHFLESLQSGIVPDDLPEDAIRDLSNWGARTARFFTMNTGSALNIAIGFEEKYGGEDPTAAIAFQRILDSYNNFEYFNSWHATGETAEALLKDPINYVSLATGAVTFGAGAVATRAGAEGGKLALRLTMARMIENRIMGTGVRAALTAGFAEGTAAGTLQNWAEQTAEISSGKIDNISISRMLTSGGMEGLMGAGFSGAGHFGARFVRNAFTRPAQAVDNALDAPTPRIDGLEIAPDAPTLNAAPLTPDALDALVIPRTEIRPVEATIAPTAPRAPEASIAPVIDTAAPAAPITPRADVAAPAAPATPDALDAIVIPRTEIRPVEATNAPTAPRAPEASIAPVIDTAAPTAPITPSIEITAPAAPAVDALPRAAIPTQRTTLSPTPRFADRLAASPLGVEGIGPSRFTPQTLSPADAGRGAAPSASSLPDAPAVPENFMRDYRTYAQRKAYIDENIKEPGQVAAFLIELDRMGHTTNGDEFLRRNLLSGEARSLYLNNRVITAERVTPEVSRPAAPAQAAEVAPAPATTTRALGADEDLSVISDADLRARTERTRLEREAQETRGTRPGAARPAEVVTPSEATPTAGRPAEVETTSKPAHPEDISSHGNDGIPPAPDVRSTHAAPGTEKGRLRIEPGRIQSILSFGSHQNFSKVSADHAKTVLDFHDVIYREASTAVEQSIRGNTASRALDDFAKGMRDISDNMNNGTLTADQATDAFKTLLADPRYAADAIRQPLDEAMNNLDRLRIRLDNLARSTNNKDPKLGITTDQYSRIATEINTQREYLANYANMYSEILQKSQTLADNIDAGKTVSASTFADAASYVSTFTAKTDDTLGTYHRDVNSPVLGNTRAERRIKFDNLSSSETVYGQKWPGNRFDVNERNLEIASNADDDYTAKSAILLGLGDGNFFRMENNVRRLEFGQTSVQNRANIVASLLERGYVNAAIEGLRNAQIRDNLSEELIAEIGKLHNPGRRITDAQYATITPIFKEGAPSIGKTIAKHLTSSWTPFGLGLNPSVAFRYPRTYMYNVGYYLTGHKMPDNIGGEATSNWLPYNPFAKEGEKLQWNVSKGDFGNIGRIIRRTTVDIPMLGLLKPTVLAGGLGAAIWGLGSTVETFTEDGTRAHTVADSIGQAGKDYLLDPSLFVVDNTWGTLIYRGLLPFEGEISIDDPAPSGTTTPTPSGPGAPPTPPADDLNIFDSNAAPAGAGDDTTVVAANNTGATDPAAVAAATAAIPAADTADAAAAQRAAAAAAERLAADTAAAAAAAAGNTADGRPVLRDPARPALPSVSGEGFSGLWDMIMPSFADGLLSSSSASQQMSGVGRTIKNAFADGASLAGNLWNAAPNWGKGLMAIAGGLLGWNFLKNIRQMFTGGGLMRLGGIVAIGLAAGHAFDYFSGNAGTDRWKNSHNTNHPDNQTPNQVGRTTINDERPNDGRIRYQEGAALQGSGSHLPADPNAVTVANARLSTGFNGAAVATDALAVAALSAGDMRITGDLTATGHENTTPYTLAQFETASADGVMTREWVDVSDMAVSGAYGADLEGDIRVSAQTGLGFDAASMVGGTYAIASLDNDGNQRAASFVPVSLTNDNAPAPAYDVVASIDPLVAIGWEVGKSSASDVVAPQTTAPLKFDELTAQV